jgi:flagellar biogenesis protein FliO
MLNNTASAKAHFKFGITAFLLLSTWCCLFERSEAQARADWQTPQLPPQNDPTLVRPPGFNIQQSVPQNASVPQPVLQPSGQRVFTPPSINDAKSGVQPASFNSESPSSTSKTANAGSNRTSTRAPLELKPSTKEKTRNLDKPTSTWSAALSMFFSLAVVLSFFLLVAWLVKKSQPTSFLKLPSDVVQVMGRTPMAPRQQMYVVRFGSKLLLISHQPGQTQTLGEITDIDEVQRLAGLCEANHPGSISNSFRDVLKQVTLGKSDPAPKASLRMSRPE